MMIDFHFKNKNLFFEADFQNYIESKTEPDQWKRIVFLETDVDNSNKSI